MKRFAVFSLLLLTSLAAACYWDYDTLREEARGKLDVVDALVGRVRRFPPVYYQRRIEIATPKAKAGDFDAYDSIAVAHSRLGNQDEAIRWIQAKRKVIADVGKVHKDVQYRTESNEGTFWLVKWLSAGEGKGKREWLERSREQVAEALKINPDAHFGREQVQLDYIDWLLLDSKKPRFGAGERGDPARRQEGLVGLVMLGAAWENTDIIGAIPILDGGAERNETSLAVLANMRIAELTGKPFPEMAVDEDGPWAASRWMVEPANAKANYARLRENAKIYQANFASFVARRVEGGFHPDKDGDRFWDGYEATPRAELIDPPFRVGTFISRQNPIVVIGILLVVLIGGLVASFFVIRWVVRRVLARNRGV